MKKILEVFSDIRLNDELNKCFRDCVVESVFLDKKQGAIGLNIILNNIVSPIKIESLKENIYRYLGYPKAIEVIINEKYFFNRPIKFKQLYEIYEDSLMYYIKKLNPICYASIIKGKTSIDELENIITYEVDNLGYNQDKISNLEKYVADIFKEKFGIEVTVELQRGDNKVYEEFIRNRDLEQKHIMRRQAEEAAVEQKVIIKEEDVEKDIDENLILGKKRIFGDIIKIKNFDEDTTYANIDVELISKPEERELKSGKFLYKFDVTDYTDSITCKCFCEADEQKRVSGELKKGNTLRIRGNYKYDNFDDGMSFMVNTIEKVETELRTKRVDLAEEKRIELHLHTQMSDMDGVMSAKNAVKQAINFGHKAVAITDHGVVQSFPDAFHSVGDSGIRIIYGMEGYLVDDMRPISYNIKGQDFESSYVVFDIETTGFRAHKDKIIEIGAVKIEGGKIIDRFSEFVNPAIAIPAKIQKLTSITDDDVKDANYIDSVLPKFIEFIGESVLVAHNAIFDMSFINYNMSRLDLNFKNEEKISNCFDEKYELINKDIKRCSHTYVDTLEMARRLMPNLKNYKLDTITDELGANLTFHHRAVYDAEATAGAFIKMQQLFKAKGIEDLQNMEEWAKSNLPNYKKMRPAHVILLCKNREGLKNLYKLVSKSHIETFFKRPLILKSFFEEYREGLVVGSACEAGELYPLILEGRGSEVIERIVEFYDYLEIQPTGNNEFMLNKNLIDNLEEIEEVNKKIIELGKSENKLTVATCDVHFQNPEDEIYRRVLMAGKGFKDADNQPPLYFRSTDEMMDEFSYLGEELAKEVVIENTNKIFEQLEYIEPVEPDKYPPKIEGAEEDLTNMCYDKARQIYGQDLPEIVEARLKKELDSIIGNGFAVMYIIAQKLVKKSNDDGYLVGSRGSVGSSFVATLSGITEVNPLSPHYICPKCKYSDFESEEVKAYARRSGVDMPDKKCPVCGTDMIKEGHDIPFETFLGFNGDKEPDIDLNFSGEYQPQAHKYTEVIFGEGHVFRAGTIGTLADKTAYGYVKNYFAEREIEVKDAEVNRIIQGCVGVRRTTGQHPGGIIVVPKDQEIYKFTPIQKPANDVNTDIITTHFDYHSIDHNLLKLDILGHDDPTMIRYLEDLTEIDATKIRLDDKGVLDLFEGLESLKITPDLIGGCTLGTLGVPEFGTNFVMNMLKETKPKSFSDLVIISGLSHGTDVWTNNAQILVQEGKVTLKTCISTRDDIMTYLINMGMDKGLSFKIMEFVRKGRGLNPDWEKAMKEADVPDWYIWSCNQIKYMFPKAHAVAYVTMAFRIAYFKVYYPIQYYSAFFSIRASNFDYELMCKGKAVLDAHIIDFTKRIDEITKKEKEMIKDMKIVQEMYARGFEFVDIDIYTVDAKYFKIIGNKLMPSLGAINGMGEKAAESIVEARKDGKFISIEDFSKRAKVSKTLIELLKENGIFKDWPETNQVSLW